MTEPARASSLQSAESNTKTIQRSKWRRIRSSPWTQLLVVIVIIALVQAYAVKLYQVPSGSMEQTLEVGDRVLVNRLAYLDSAPRVGDIVVFDKPANWAKPPTRSAFRTAIGWLGDLVGFGPSNHDTLVKRVIGTPGHRVACCDVRGRVTIDGKPLDEPYIKQDFPFAAGRLDCTTVPISQRCFETISLGPDEYVVLGDHRSVSADSVIGCRGARAGTGPPDRIASCARTVGREDIVGKVMLVVFPFTRWGARGEVGPSSNPRRHLLLPQCRNQSCPNRPRLRHLDRLGINEQPSR